MANRLKILGLISMIAMFAACGILASRQQESTLHRIESNHQILYVVPEGDITGGILYYSIYENGFIQYHGDISYSIFDFNKRTNVELQPSFQGSYKAKIETVMSETYRGLKDSHQEYKTTFVPLQIAESGKLAELLILAEQEDVTGRMVIDSSEKTIKVISVELTGPTPLGRKTLKLTNQKPIVTSQK